MAKKRGAKSKYESLVKPYLDKINEKIRQGVTEEAIAIELGICVATLNNYKNIYPELKEALSKNKGADVLNDLINEGISSAKGHWVEETVTIYQPDEDGKPVLKQMTVNKKWVEPNAALNKYYVNNFGKEQGFSNNPLENNMRKQEIEFKQKIDGIKNGLWPE